ncbi:MAG: hypothetical protein HZA61_11755 [Candidatus Eisenbacteria bacterium]|uniref:Uncharacterized protein n=1 Tax=Eiseniibacteriota bacterium TaxID=2212470 RepID=A0A933W928_UNCEI|nr:hypothetical protein [Candidatus Eisenbacteria bacterium]
MPTTESPTRTLDAQREEYARRRFIAMPLAGAIAWTLVGVAGLYLKPGTAALALFVATGMIAYLGMFLSNFTGERFLDRDKPKNEFDALFFHTVAMALLVYAVAIPFFRQDLTSLPLGVGVLTGLMWLPFSWCVRHWIGIFHTIVRTLACVVLWYALPEQRFVAIPFAIVAIYAVTIVVLERRWRALRSAA